MSGTGKGNLVPIADAVERDDAIHVPFDLTRVQGAPSMPGAGGLSEEEEAELYQHYGLDYVPRPIELDLEPAPDRLRSVH